MKVEIFLKEIKTLTQLEKSIIPSDVARIIKYDQTVQEIDR